MVPDVMTTEENRSKTGAIASDGSRQLEIRQLPLIETHRCHNVRGRDGLHCMKDRIGNSSVFRFIRFENEQEPLLVRRNQRSERSDFLQCVVLVDIRQLQGTDQRSQSFRCEPVHQLVPRLTGDLGQELT